MALTDPQKAAIKADILASPDLNSQPNTPDGADAIAKLYNLPAAPDFWVWRTNVTRSDLYHTTSPDGTTWDWAVYKNQSQGEQGAWVQMFMGDQANFALPSLRAGIAVIFGNTAPQTAQRNHCLSVGRRKATRIEKLLAAGTGSTVSPATMSFEGAITFQDVQDARNS